MNNYEHQLPYFSASMQRLIDTCFELMHHEFWLRRYELEPPKKLNDEISMATFHINAAVTKVAAVRDAFKEVIESTKPSKQV